MKTVIKAGTPFNFSLAELRAHAGLLRYLSLRDVYARYKQTWLGFGWSIIRPVVNIVIFGSISFLIDRSQDPTERFLSVSAGIIFWQLLSTATTEVSNSLSSNSGILTKVYFPRLILPASALLVCLIDFLIAFLIFLACFVFLKGIPGWTIITLPLIVFHGMLLSFSLGLLFATASVKYRDVKFILPFLIQIMFYASPVFMSTDYFLALNIPQWMKTLYVLNPYVFLLNGFRYSFYGTPEGITSISAVASFAITILLLLWSVRYFLKFEQTFADYI